MWLWCLVALANDGPSPVLHAEQVGQDVEITMRVYEGGEPGLGNEISLTRDDETLFEDRVYSSSDDPVGSGTYCGGGDNVLWDEDGRIDCDEKPEKCQTCGERMCPVGGCFLWYEFLEVDVCVPPGQHTWTVPQGYEASVDLNVVDNEKCGGGCGGCDSTPGAPGLALGLLMLGIGAVARKRPVV